MHEMPRFICDVMLGRLSRRLRLFGFDCLYFRFIHDNEIIAVARSQSRIVLTRDNDLSRRMNAALHGDPLCLFIENQNDPSQQTAQVFHHLFSLSSDADIIRKLTDRMMTRCPDCNGILSATRKDMVFNAVPEPVFRSHDTFRLCCGCGKVYWNGSHFHDIRIRMKSVLDETFPGHISCDE